MCTLQEKKLLSFFFQGGLEASEKKKRSSGFVFSRFTNVLSSLRRKTCHPTKFTAFSIPENEGLEPASAASMATTSTIGNSFIQPNSCSSFYIEKTTSTKSEIKVTDKDVSKEEQPDDIEHKEEDDLTDVEKVLSRCSDKEIISFETMYEPARLSKALKVGEGSFGEVFLLPTDTDSDPPVVKIGKSTTIFT